MLLIDDTGILFKILYEKSEHGKRNMAVALNIRFSD